MAAAPAASAAVAAMGNSFFLSSQWMLFSAVLLKFQMNLTLLFCFCNILFLFTYMADAAACTLT